MYVNGIDEDRLTRGVQIALDMMVDDHLCSVMVVGIHADGRGFKCWSGGDERVADQVRETLTKTLPLTPSSPPLQHNNDADADGA